MAIIVPVYNTVVLPDSTMYLSIDNFRNITGREAKIGDRVIFTILKEDISKEDFTEDSFEPLGAFGTVTDVSTPNSYIAVHLDSRIAFEDLAVNADHSINIMTIIRKPENEDLDPEEEKKRVEAMKASIVKSYSKTQWAVWTRSFVAGLRTPGDIITSLAQWIGVKPEEKYALLKEDSLSKRLDMIEKMIYGYTEITNVTNEAQSAQEQNN